MCTRVGVASLAFSLLAALAWPAPSAGALPAAAEALELRNAEVVARFADRGLASLESLSLRRALSFSSDPFSLEIDGKTFRAADFPAPTIEKSPAQVTFTFSNAAYRVRVVYELRPGWKFLSKQIFLSLTAPARTARIGAVVPLDLPLAESPQSVYIPRNRSWEKRPSSKDFGAFFRFAGRTGLFALVQNPFLNVRHDAGSFQIAYTAGMDWNFADGDFLVDRACLGLYALSGQMVPVDLLPEWKLAADSTAAGPSEDEAEIQAYEDCVRAFLLDTPSRSTKIEVGWTLNDYQIDIATPAGRA
ncbi:MAG: hypothetical protein ACRD5L_13315 [Bryobacteraceae bacterium]